MSDSRDELIAKLTELLNEMIVAISGPMPELLKVIEKANRLLDQINKGDK
jgi:hypothetical protein